MPALPDLCQDSRRSPLLGRKIAVIGKRHARAFPAQRVHDAGEILSGNEQVLIEPDPRRVSASALNEARRIIVRQIGPIEPGYSASCPTSYWIRASTAAFGRVLRKSHVSRLEMLSIAVRSSLAASGRGQYIERAQIHAKALLGLRRRASDEAA